MHRLVLAFFLIPALCFSQTEYTFKDVNSKTYSALIEGNWNEVIRVGEEAINQGHNFYYLNLRLGIAYFHAESNFKANNYLTKAALQNNSDTLVNLYCYWNHLQLGNNILANHYRLQIPAATRKNQRISQHNLNSISMGVGVKKPTSINYGETMSTISPSINFNLSKRISSTFYGGKTNQSLYWGEFEQSNIGITTNYLFNTQTIISSNINYNKIASTIDFENNEVQTSGRSITQAITGNLTWLGIFNRSKLSVGYTASFQPIEITGDTSYSNHYNNLSFTNYFHQFEIGASTTLKPLNNGLVIYGNFHTPILDSQFGWSGILGFKIKPKIKSWIGFSYLYNSNLNTIENYGSLIQNGDYLNQRIRLTWDYYRNKKWSFNSSFSKEFKTEELSSFTYNNISIFSTITYKF